MHQLIILEIQVQALAKTKSSLILFASGLNSNLLVVNYWPTITIIWTFESTCLRSACLSIPEFVQESFCKSGHMASAIHPKDPGSNLSIDRKYFVILFVLYLKSNL
jgi:hypothetical protein